MAITTAEKRDLSALKHTELSLILSSMGLSITGTKEELVERILAAREKVSADKNKKRRSLKGHGKMGNPTPIQTEEFKEHIRKPLGKLPGDIPLGSKVWGLKLPQDVEDYLNEWDSQNKAERISWMRSLIVNEVRERINQDG
jgi:hypothetical protein